MKSQLSVNQQQVCSYSSAMSHHVGWDPADVHNTSSVVLILQLDQLLAVVLERDIRHAVPIISFWSRLLLPSCFLPSLLDGNRVLKSLLLCILLNILLNCLSLPVRWFARLQGVCGCHAEVLSTFCLSEQRGQCGTFLSLSSSCKHCKGHE